MMWTLAIMAANLRRIAITRTRNSLLSIHSPIQAAAGMNRESTQILCSTKFVQRNAKLISVLRNRHLEFAAKTAEFIQFVSSFCLVGFIAARHIINQKELVISSPCRICCCVHCTLEKICPFELLPTLTCTKSCAGIVLNVTFNL